MGYAGGLKTNISCSYLTGTELLPLANQTSTDSDIFLQGAHCDMLHPGIREAVKQSLDCFRRGLYMPSTVMLAAAAEAVWTECGVAVAKRLVNMKLESVVADPLASISKKVVAVRKVLEQHDGQALLKAAGQHAAKVADAELWTTTLRDRRNALHWSKGLCLLTGLALVGFMGEQQAIHYLHTRCIPKSQDPNEPLACWVEATARLGSPISDAGRPDIQDIPSEHATHLQAVQSAPRSPKSSAK